MGGWCTVGGFLSARTFVNVAIVVVDGLLEASGIDVADVEKKVQVMKRARKRLLLLQLHKAQDRK